MAGPISKQQVALNRSLHQSDPSFGSRKNASGFRGNQPACMHEHGVCSSVLDYGTGKGLLVDRLLSELPASIQVTGYDPAVERWSCKPQEPHDIVTCLDVLEHVEIDSIDETINDIKSMTKLFCYEVIDLQPAVKKLADGRNAHVLLAPSEWWVSRFSQTFSSITSFPVKHKCGTNQKVVIALSKTGVFTSDVQFSQ